MRFKKLPDANDPIAYPNSNWATSHTCDICGLPDWDKTFEGKDITIFYEDTKTGFKVCEYCKRKII